MTVQRASPVAHHDCGTFSATLPGVNAVEMEIECAISDAGILGGGTNPGPGEVSLSHIDRW